MIDTYDHANEFEVRANTRSEAKSKANRLMSHGKFSLDRVEEIISTPAIEQSEGRRRIEQVFNTVGATTGRSSGGNK